MTQAFYDQWEALFREAHALMEDRTLLTILTPVIRPEGVAAVVRSIQAATPHDLTIRHVVEHYPHQPDPNCGPERAAWATRLLHSVRGGWVLWVDDDNRLHPDLPRRLGELAEAYPEAQAFVFDCQYPEAGGVLRAGRITPGQVDGGQVVLWHSLARQEPWPIGVMADGRYMQRLYAHDPAAWVFVPEPLTYHNHQVWG